MRSAAVAIAAQYGRRSQGEAFCGKAGLPAKLGFTAKGEQPRESMADKRAESTRMIADCFEQRC